MGFEGKALASFVLMKMQDMPQGQALSTEPILANEHIRVASPQAGGDFGRTAVLPVPRLVSEVISACDNGCCPTVACISVQLFFNSPHQIFERSHVNSQQMHILRLLHCEVQDVLPSCPYCLGRLHLDVGYSTHIAQQVHAYTRTDSTAFTTDLASHTVI